MFETAFFIAPVSTQLLQATQTMDVKLLSSMKVEELKAYLRLRGLKVSGRKEELVARAFVAMENNVPIVRTAEEVEKPLACQYSTKLKVFFLTKLEGKKFQILSSSQKDGFLKRMESNSGLLQCTQIFSTFWHSTQMNWQVKIFLIIKPLTGTLITRMDG